MTSQFETVLYDVKDGVATICLNRPDSKNAFNRQMRNELANALAEAGRDAEVRVMVLSGSDAAFSTGQDLVEGLEGGPAIVSLVNEEYGPIIHRINQTSKLVIAAIEGPCAGIGTAIALACDFVVMADNARFFFPEVSLGIFVTGGVTRLLPQQIGTAKARRMILLGGRYSAQDVPMLGFDWQVVSADDMTAQAHALAANIAALPQGPVRDLKQALRESAGTDLEGAMAIETEATLRGFLDPESAERARDRLG